jgi:hypothetical protein
MWYVFFQVSFAVLDMRLGGGKHRICLCWLPLRRGRREQLGEVDRPHGGNRRRRDGWGKVPEEDEGHPPRAAPGSRNLPWDARKIPREPVESQASARPPGGGWDGGLACARGVDGGIVPGNGTSGIAESRSAGERCVAGRRRGGNGPGGHRRKGVRNTRRRSVLGGGEAPVRASPRWTAIRRRRSGLGPARGHAAKPLFRAWCATGRVVTNLRGTRGERRHPIAAMPAAGPCVGCGTESASIWPARRKPAD